MGGYKPDPGVQFTIVTATTAVVNNVTGLEGTIAYTGSSAGDRYVWHIVPRQHCPPIEVVKASPSATNPLVFTDLTASAGVDVGQITGLDTASMSGVTAKVDFGDGTRQRRSRTAH